MTFDGRTYSIYSIERERKLALWLQWCLDNCEFSPEATAHMHALLCGYNAPEPPNATQSNG